MGLPLCKGMSPNEWIINITESSVLRTPVSKKYVSTGFHINHIKLNGVCYNGLTLEFIKRRPTNKTVTSISVGIGGSMGVVLVPIS